MRTFSPAASLAMTSAQTGEVSLVLLTLTAPGIADPIRVVNNVDPVTSHGLTYQPYAFDFAKSSEDGKTLPQARLVIDNVDLRMIQALRGATGPIQIDAQQVLASQPDIVEFSAPGMILRQVTYDAKQISGNLYPDDILNSLLPGDTYNPQEFRALF